MKAMTAMKAMLAMEGNDSFSVRPVGRKALATKQPLLVVGDRHVQSPQSSCLGVGVHGICCIPCISAKRKSAQSLANRDHSRSTPARAKSEDRMRTVNGLSTALYAANAAWQHEVWWTAVSLQARPSAPHCATHLQWPRLFVEHDLSCGAWELFHWYFT